MKFKSAFLFFILLPTLLLGYGCENDMTLPSKKLNFKNVMIFLGPYESEDKAIKDEMFIDWEQEFEKANAITQAFASIELKNHLKLIGENVNILRYDKKEIKNTIILISEKLLKEKHPEIALRIDSESLGNQGFAIISERKNLFIIGKTRIGILYGTYEFLRKIGFSWYNPKETILPKKINGYLKSYETVKNPFVDLRGFWTVSEENLPENYVLWLVRNKFNLVGKTKPYLARKLGLKIWGGGHEIIQEEFSKEGLFEENPDWYILNKNKRHAVSTKGNYINPSFASREAANYFSKRLIERLRMGDLKNIDIINIWPADKKRSLLDESDRAKSIGNFSDNLLHFYLIVADNIEEAFKNKVLSRKVILAGISYHQTMISPTNKSIIKQLKTKNYLHVFYPSTRDWSYSLNGNQKYSPTNLKLLKGINSWKEHTNFTFGAVDYNHKSNYYGIAITNHNNFAADFDYFFPKKGGLYAYMHPIKDNPGPLELTNALIAQMSWKQQTEQSENLQSNIVDRYFDEKYGKWGEEWLNIYNEMMKAVSNSKYIFETGSLSSVLFQKVYWSKPPFKNEEVIELIAKYREGGSQNLLDGYTNKKDLLGNTKFIGLYESLDIQKELQEKWLSIASRIKNPQIRNRIENDITWFETTLKRYELISLCSDLVVIEYLNEDSEEIRIRINNLMDFLSKSKATSDVFSPVHSGSFLRVVQKFMTKDLP